MTINTEILDAKKSEPDPFVILSKKRRDQLKALDKLIDHYRLEAARKPNLKTLNNAISLRDDLLKEIASMTASAVVGVHFIKGHHDSE